MQGWVDGWWMEDGWMDGWTDGRMDGWMDGWTHGWMHGCKDVCLLAWLPCLLVCLFVSVCQTYVCLCVVGLSVLYAYVHIIMTSYVSKYNLFTYIHICTNK